MKVGNETRDCVVRSTYQTTLRCTICNPATKEVREENVILRRDSAVKKINARIVEEINAQLPEGWKHVSSEIKNVKFKKFAMKKLDFYNNAIELED